MQLAFHRVLQSGLAAEATIPAADEKWSLNADAVDELHRDDPRAIDFRNSLRSWFHFKQWSQLRRQELRGWLYWAMFNAPLPANDSDVPHAHHSAIENVLELVRRRTGCEVPEGSDPTCKSLLLTLDPLNVWARPLLWYIFVWAANAVVWWRMTRQWNVQHGRFQGLEYAAMCSLMKYFVLMVFNRYIIHLPDSSTKVRPGESTRPIVIMHGLGLGLFQYYSLLHHMFDAFPHRPMVIPLQPHISQAIFHPSFLTPMDRYSMVHALAGLLTSLGWVNDEDDTMKVVDPGISRRPASPTSNGVTMLSHSK
jgi:hypothetical protein